MAKWFTRRWWAGIPGITRVEVVTLAPGDVIVVECSQPLSQSSIERLREECESLFVGHRVAVLLGITLKVIRTDHVPAELLRSGGTDD